MTVRFSDLIATAALVISLVALVTGEIRARRVARKNRLLGPHDAIRKALVAVRDDFGTIVALGGQRMKYFIDDSKRLTETQLSDLAGQVGDHDLKTRILLVAGTWGAAFENAPPARVQISTATSDNASNRAQNLKDSARLERQVEIANHGIDYCEEAITRLNDILLS